MSVLLAINAASALTSFAINAMEASQKYQTLIATARAENREVTDEELATLAAETDALVNQANAALLGTTPAIPSVNSDPPAA